MTTPSSNLPISDKPGPHEQPDASTLKSHTLYRADIATPPDRIRRLPIRRGYPVPWFVAWVNGEPEFRIMDGAKLVRAIKEHLCWVCGQKMGAHSAFVVGPMCVVNRTSAEPPAHLTCAEYSAVNCPFLSRPTMRRREGGLPDETTQHSAAIMRNPGVAIVYVTRTYEVFNAGEGRVLLRMGPPSSVLAYAEGRQATSDEIAASMRSGIPLLQKTAADEGPDAVRQLQKMTAAAASLLRLPAGWERDPAAALEAPATQAAMEL